MTMHTVAPAAADGAGNLARIKHIVVLMMENRSFDHMLGYLSLEGGRADIDGLQESFANMHLGRRYAVHHLQGSALGQGQSPGHGGADVARQLAGHNGGFVDDYALGHPDDADPGLVMGYYNASQLPVYDFLAAQFCVCDRWFSSVPGATWPNRLYAMSGRAAGSKDNIAVPLYSNASFLRHLDRAHVSWKFYSERKPWTLALTDEQYRSSENYEPFGGPQWRYGFVGDALAGTLPSVAWIDPHFFADDDHPPADLRAGQALVARVYQALSRGPGWQETLLILCYDEHGGFYDHVVPGPAADADPAFRQYGLRVPALLVCPWVAAASVYHGVLDHTSIIKTILARFCDGVAGTLPDMGPRVAAAAHVGAALAGGSARPAPDLSAAALAQWSAWQAQTWDAPALMLLSDEEAGAIAAEKLIAKWARRASAAAGAAGTPP